MTFGTLWKELEAAPARRGLVRRRLAPDSACDLYLAVRKPANERILLLHLGPSSVELPYVPPGRVLALRSSEISDGGGAAVELALVSSAYADLFDALVADIVSVLEPVASPGECATQLVSRLVRWQSFLDTATEGLGSERQRGLYGELWVMRAILPTVGASHATTRWTGPSQAAQDFSFGDVAIEVKTTIGKQHQKMAITSERQLDASPLRRLFVYHLSLDARSGTGETLPSLVDAVRGALAADTAALDALDTKLLEGGYHEVHAHLYDLGYTLRSRAIFEVGAGFPAITEAMVPSGVGDVKYTVAVSACSDFTVDDQQLNVELTRIRDGSQ